MGVACVGYCLLAPTTDIPLEDGAASVPQATGSSVLTLGLAW